MRLPNAEYLARKGFYISSGFALIIRNSCSCEGADFIMPNEYSQQLAYMHHPVGKIIDAYIHNMVHRNAVLTQEILFAEKGIVWIELYDEYEDYLESRNLYAGENATKRFACLEEN